MVGLPLTLSEMDLLRLVLEFLETRGLHISQVSLERETGLINGLYSEDLLFLRQLVLDGQWDSALDFAQPLAALPDFRAKDFSYLLTKYKYYELLCLKQDPGPLQNHDFTVEEVVETLKALEGLCPSQEDYRQLCALLTLPKLSDHAEFKRWDPQSARVECFHKVEPLLAKFLPPDKGAHADLKGSIQASQLGQPIPAAVNDRLVQLVAKGLFYEAAMDFCQGKAVREDVGQGVRLPAVLEARNKLATPDLSLVSWLEALPNDQFSLPFEQKSLELSWERLKRPQLQADWSEAILATPLKPQAFPHSAVPNIRLRAAEKMSQSMHPRINGLGAMSMMMTASAVLPGGPSAGPMSQSMAPGFQIRQHAASQPPEGTAAMQQSQLDSLFESSALTRSTMGGLGPEPPSQPQPVPQQPPQGASNSPQPAQMVGGGAEMSPRQQLEELARRSQSLPPSSAYAKPNTSSPSHAQGGPGGGRLFQEFSTRHPARMMTASQYRASSEPAPPTFSQMESLSYGMANAGLSQRLPVVAELEPSRVSPSPYAAPSQPPPAADYAPAAPRMRVHQDNRTAGPSGGGGGMKNVEFMAVARLEDSQAIRTAAFHPSGRFFAVGTNSKQLHVCRYPDMRRLTAGEPPKSPEIVLTRPKQHRGSVYCCGFNPTGELLATGSNDKTVRLMSFLADSGRIGAEMELGMHDGTVRDLVFMEDTTNRTSLLISGGAGSCAIHTTDCATGQTFRSLAGHTAPILGLYAFGGCTFVSCSQDKTIRFWDLRCPQAVNLISPGNRSLSSPVTSVCCDPQGRLLVSGHEDASVMLYDVQGSRVLQLYRPHGDEVRAVRFSPGTYYLLSASYDRKVAITDMRGDLTSPLLYLPVAEHSDKVIQCRWHPHDFTFLSTSADRSAVLWALPPASQAY